ncbi:MAG: dihydroorotase [Eubacteriales bacterium]|nr:dihydroorotase [Eubacteriales bacterium]
MSIFIKGGRVVDAATGKDTIEDIYINDGLIQKMGSNLEFNNADTVIDAAGKLVMPGVIDLHVHLRDPGLTYKEDIESGSKAAARGGVTTIIAMPNTKPVIDSPESLKYVLEKAKRVAPIHVLQTGSMTVGLEGEKLSDIKGMAEAGVIALSEDGKSVMNSALCQKAMEEAVKYGLPILDHCEEINLRGNGCMNEDENSKRLGLPGISNAVEDVITARDIMLAVDAGARLHLCHISTEGVANMMRILKNEGIENVTAEVCPHHFILTSDDIPGDDPNYKMNPPLRQKADVEALIKGLQDGSIQAISTDHAPHSAEDKAGSMATAAFGIVGLETSLPLTYTELVEKGYLTTLQMVEKMCWNPAQILGLTSGTLQEGRPADVIVVDTEKEYTIDKEKFVSKGKNTPFHGRKVKGKVLYTICDGNVVFTENNF